MDKEKELQEAWEKAYSIESRDTEEDRHEDLKFIGIICKGDRTYRFYQGTETGNYWYQSKKMADTSKDVSAGSQ